MIQKAKTSWRVETQLHNLLQFECNQQWHVKLWPVTVSLLLGSHNTLSWSSIAGFISAKGMWSISIRTAKQGEKSHWITIMVRMCVFSYLRWKVSESFILFGVCQLVSGGISDSVIHDFAGNSCCSRALPIIIAVIVRSRHKAAITVRTEWLTWPPHRNSTWPRFIPCEVDNGSVVSVVLSGWEKKTPKSHLHDDKMTWGP